MLHPLGPRRGGIDVAQLGIDEAHLGRLPSGFVAAMDLQLLSAKTAASEYASASFQRLTKLSWQLAHLRLVPRNTCDRFCAACTGGVWLALTTPRQTMPLVNPVEPGTGLMSWCTNRS